jgi:Right handed beta helix region
MEGRLKSFVAALLAAGCLFALALPATAFAEVNIDSAADEPDAVAGGVCETAAGDCTLRAAIEVANLAGTAQDIFFAGEFNGTPGDDTVVLTSPLPAIKAPVSIIAGRTGSPSKPTAGVSGPTGNFGITVEADGVTIRNLSITGALTGINVINKSENFTATGNWIGVKLDGNAGANNTGIFIDPESDGASIGASTGGLEVEQPNVIAGNTLEGLDIEGASDAVIHGNYFGVAPDGTSPMANGKNIEITDSTAGTGSQAENNEVGGTITGPAVPCDGACNVIAGSGFAGVDLRGEDGVNEKPATGPTTIHGNYVGMGANGTTFVPNLYGIWSVGAGDVTVGGPAAGDANFITAGATGIFYSSGEGFKAQGNVLGSGAGGADVTSPAAGMFISTENNNLPVAILGNVIEMEGGVAIEARWGGAEIRNSFIEGAELGIWTKVSPGSAGANLIEDNVIGESLSNGIRIEDNANLVFGNSIYDSGAAGIRIQSPAPLLNAIENQIGGNTPNRENNIRESGGDAIEIDNSAGEGASFNEVARNRGEKNAGAFIDLVGPLTNGGIQPPAFATALQSSASGSGAEPGATIRVFRKKAAEAGELDSFLAEAIADGSGNWSLTYAQIPTGTIVAATQTSEAGGTSELSTATAAADPSTGGGGSGGNGVGGGGSVIVCKPSIKTPCPGGPDRTAPQTKVLKGPKGKVAKTTVKFKFSSSEKGSTFRCKLDRKPYRVCKSPKTYRKLKLGKHVFKVRAVDRAGNIDPTAAKRKFTILG